jgi:NTE family protein
MVTGELKVFDDDIKVADAILASSSFPGVMSPYIIDGHMYSDGGILNHFPTDLLRNQCNHLIGVYVSPIQSITRKDLNSIKAVTARAFDLLSAQSNLSKFELCDWVIEPKELCQYSTFETSKQRMKEIFTIGYNTAKKSHENFISKGVKGVRW